MSEAEIIIDYTNWKGERRERRILPLSHSLAFRETPYHKPAQWVFDAVDVEKPDRPARTFALKDVHAWRTAP